MSFHQHHLLKQSWQKSLGQFLSASGQVWASLKPGKVTCTLGKRAKKPVAACSGWPCFVQEGRTGPSHSRDPVTAGRWEDGNEEPGLAPSWPQATEQSCLGKARVFCGVLAASGKPSRGAVGSPPFRRGGGTRRGLLTGGAGWRRRRPQTARAGGASARHRRPASAGGQPARHEGKSRGEAKRTGRPPWGGSVRGETGQGPAGGRTPGRGGAPERSPSPLTSGGSSSSLGLHHFLWGGLPPPRPTPAPDGAVVRPGPARAAVEGRPGGAGRGSADRKSGRRKAGMAVVGRLGKQKDGGGDGKQSGEVSVGAKAGEARGGWLQAPGKVAAGWGGSPHPPPARPGLQQVPAQESVLIYKTLNTTYKVFI